MTTATTATTTVEHNDFTQTQTQTNGAMETDRVFGARVPTSSTQTIKQIERRKTLVVCVCAGVRDGVGGTYVAEDIDDDGRAKYKAAERRKTEANRKRKN